MQESLQFPEAIDALICGEPTRENVIAATVLSIKWGQSLDTRRKLADTFREITDDSEGIKMWEERAATLESLRSRLQISDDEAIAAYENDKKN